MVQRYTTLAGYVEDDDGHFVEYEDYAALQSKVREYAFAVWELDELKNTIRKAGPAPHTDFWHQSLFNAEKKIEDALAQLKDLGV